MIKFFRHIRKSLLMENKTGKYFKYAIGEIFLVVIGILIALQINNWNENRIAQNNEKIILLKLIDDLETDSIRIKSQHNRIISISELHRNLYLIGKGKLPSGSLQNTEFLRAGTIFDSALRNDPQLTNKISNSTIRDQLVFYLDRLRFIESEIDNYKNLLENRVRPYLAEWNLLDIDSRFENPEFKEVGIYDDKLIKHLNRPGFQQLLYEANVKVRGIEYRYDQLKEANTLLKGLINNELKQNR